MWGVGVAVVLAAAATVSASGLEDAVRSRLRGAWGVVEVEVYSGCAGSYANNRISGTLVTSKTDRRFEPGELAKIDKVNVKRARVDVMVSLAEPLLVSRIDGPFELFDVRECRVQLMVEVPRQVVKAGDVNAVMEAVSAVLETHPSRAAAQDSELWNRRQRDPYPEDYELTLARYEVWKAEQHNVAVTARSQEALEDSVRIVERIRRDPAYLDGFAAGVELMREWRERDCDDLVDVRFSSEEHDPPGEHRDQRPWRDGFRDGQELVFSLMLVDRLERCFVAVPSAPDW